MHRLSSAEKFIVILSLVFIVVIVLFNVYDITIDKQSYYTHQDIESMKAEKVNINTADIATLCSLKGVGVSTAESIIEYRNTHGEFENIEQIMLVSGIGETDFIILAPHICVK